MGPSDYRKVPTLHTYGIIMYSPTLSLVCAYTHLGALLHWTAVSPLKCAYTLREASNMKTAFHQGLSANAVPPCDVVVGCFHQAALP